MIQAACGIIVMGYKIKIMIYKIFHDSLSIKNHQHLDYSQYALSCIVQIQNVTTTDVFA